MISEIRGKDGGRECCEVAGALIVAPAVLGCAAGVLIGRGLSVRGSGLLAGALALAAVGVAVPAVTRVVTRMVYAPGSELGSRRRLEGIRRGAGIAPDDNFYAELEREVD
jgi:hypothetical protein